MDTIPGTLRFALRTLTRNPAFTVVVIITVAVAIGATATILGVVNATIVRPLPFRDAGQLVVAEGRELREQAPRGLSYLEAMDWRAMSNAFDGLAAYDQVSLNIADAGGEPVRAIAEIVTADFFRILGVNAARGRSFLDEEHRAPDAHAVAIISDDLWRTRFGASEATVGGAITLNEQPFTIVGVMPPRAVVRHRSVDSDDDGVGDPPGFDPGQPGEPVARRRGTHEAGSFARRSAADLERVTTVLAGECPATNTDRGARLTSLRDFYGLLAFIVGMSRREIAIRLALGAEAATVVGLIVRKGMALVATGGLLGILITVLSSRGLASLLFEARLSDPVMVAGVSALLLSASLIACWIPARRASRIAPQAALKEE